jgi:photosystem II stability/assembly factor-like uncharacterized protein
MVAEQSVWRTADGGGTWKQRKSPAGLIRVHFLDPTHGWAIGSGKAAYETTDGGDTWNPLPAAQEPKSTPEYTTYNSISFANSREGMITGYSRPPRRGEIALREIPGMTIMLQTHDGGKTWQPSATSMFGIISRVRLTAGGSWVALLEYMGTFQYPSEVVQIGGGAARSVFRSQDRAVTDLMMLPGGPALLAGIETMKDIVRPVPPGKVKILRSNDLNSWEEMDVDHRATGRRVVLASSAGEVWSATDSGMILKLSLE